jgi:heterotetrameric sarcosine oxidase delta subunit
MLLIPCPNCGLRAEEEFAYGGPQRPLPPLDGTADTFTWHRMLHGPDAPGASVTEHWYHHAGCESWITLRRDLRSHAFQTAPT